MVNDSMPGRTWLVHILLAAAATPVLHKFALAAFNCEFVVQCKHYNDSINMAIYATSLSHAQYLFKCQRNKHILQLTVSCSCIDVSMELLRRTWWTVVHLQQKSMAVNICVLPLSGSWSYLAIDWTVSVVAAFLWRASRLGIRCQTVFVTQNWVSILSNVSWRHTFLRNIDDKMY